MNTSPPMVYLWCRRRPPGIASAIDLTLSAEADKDPETSQRKDPKRFVAEFLMPRR
jgi:hypothetical protein